MEEKNYNEPDYFICDGQKFAFDWKISQNPLDRIITYTEDWLHPPSKRFRCHSKKRLQKLMAILRRLKKSNSLSLLLHESI